MNKIYNFREGAAAAGDRAHQANGDIFLDFCLPALKRISLFAGICQTRHPTIPSLGSGLGPKAKVVQVATVCLPSTGAI